MRVLLSPFFSVFLAMTMPALAHAQMSMAVARMQTQEYPTLLQGTPVTLLLDQTVGGEYSKVGQRVRFEVAHDVRLGDRVLIPKGVLALGTVTLATRQHFLGHAGRVSVAIAALRLPGGQVVRLSFSPEVDENRKSGGAALIPAGFDSASKRRRAEIAQGTEVRAFVRTNTLVFQQMASVSCEQVATGTIALFGDAYAARWFPAFVELGRDHRAQLIHRNSSSCPAMGAR